MGGKLQCGPGSTFLPHNEPGHEANDVFSALVEVYLPIAYFW